MTRHAMNIEALTITLPGGRTLLRDANLTVDAGEFIVLAGPSGSGKSTLLNLMVRPGDSTMEVSGDVCVRDGATAGVVFQELALFDEFSPEDNVQFAIDHRAKAGDGGEATRRLSELSVPLRTGTSTLSGGERQRVALARTLAMEPDILLFDEPTTGLDPRRAKAVADLISRTHRESEGKRTVIVVSHDYAAFIPHQPRMVLLDPSEKCLRDVTPQELDDFFQDQTDGGEGVRQAAAPKGRLRTMAEAPGEAILTLLGAADAPLRGWSRPKWKIRYLLHYLRIVLFGTTALYVAIAGVLLGFVTVFFGFSQLPYRDMTLPLVMEEFLAATGYGAFRVVAPLLICVLIAGKCGAAIAADVGTRRLTHQFEAMRSLGGEPRHYLYGNIVLSMTVAAPVLTLIAFVANCYASLVAFLLASDGATVSVFRRNYFTTLWTDTILPEGTGWVLLKTAASGLLIAALSYAIGSRPKPSHTDVSRDVGLTIFWASLAVLGLHSAFAFFEF